MLWSAILLSFVLFWVFTAAEPVTPGLDGLKQLTPCLAVGGLAGQSGCWPGCAVGLAGLWPCGHTARGCPAGLLPYACCLAASPRALLSTGLLFREVIEPLVLSSKSTKVGAARPLRGLHWELAPRLVHHVSGSSQSPVGCGRGRGRGECWTGLTGSSPKGTRASTMMIPSPGVRSGSGLYPSFLCRRLTLGSSPSLAPQLSL